MMKRFVRIQYKMTTTGIVQGARYLGWETYMNQWGLTGLIRLAGLCKRLESTERFDS